jgi:hypothetical protein
MLLLWYQKWNTAHQYNRRMTTVQRERKVPSLAFEIKTYNIITYAHTSNESLATTHRVESTIGKYIDTHVLTPDSKWKELVLPMVFIPQRSDTTRQRKGAPLELQQSRQGSIRRIPMFLVVLCGIQAVVILIICIIVASHLFPGPSVITPPVHPAPTPGKVVLKTRSQNIHPALIEIGDYSIAVTIFFSPGIVA